VLGVVTGLLGVWAVFFLIMPGRQDGIQRRELRRRGLVCQPAEGGWMRLGKDGWSSSIAARACARGPWRAVPDSPAATPRHRELMQDRCGGWKAAPPTR
jgi:hypothetical protein